MSTSRLQQAVFERGNPRKENNRKWRYLTQYPRTQPAMATQQIEGCDSPNITLFSFGLPFEEDSALEPDNSFSSSKRSQVVAKRNSLPKGGSKQSPTD